MRMRGLRSGIALLAVAGATSAAGAAGAAEWVEEGDLQSMDLEDLMDLEVTTASKRATKVSETPAAVFVISQEDIRRSGATTVPEVLRLAPGVHVRQIDSNTWAISSRGFNDEFSNKLLVMIDGRSIYTPLFSGVIWQEHELMLEDVERIEVVRGPGGTVWGANAVNGVIHIITKDARDTQGLLATTLAGDQETFTGAARYGGAIGDDMHYRVYGKFADRDTFESSTGLDGNDDWKNVRAGARFDWALSESDRFTLQGDFLEGEAGRTIASALAPLGIPDEDEYTGGNVMARYSHSFSDTADLSLQVYYATIDRESNILNEDRDTLDVDFQHSFTPFARNQVVWGAGYRRSMDDIGSSPGIAFLDASQDDDLYSVFVQDEIAVVRDLLSFTVGSKFEHNDYTGFEVQPSARAMLTPHERHSFWASVSRAVRTPSRADSDIFIFQPTSPTTGLQIIGSSDFDSEDTLAYEVGYRTRPVDQFTFDVAAFYNQYDDLRTLNTVAIGPVVTQIFDNNMKGDGYGAEVAANWAVADFLMLSGTYTFTRNDLTLKTGGNDLSSVGSSETLTPRNQFRVTSHFILPWDFELDASLGWSERLRGTAIDAYTRLDLRLAWQPVENLEVALVGLNLIEEHQEFPTTFLTLPSEVPRSFYGTVRWLFR